MTNKSELDREITADEVFTVSNGVLTFFDGVTDFKDRSLFYSVDCSSIKKVNIPASMVDIRVDMFEDFENVIEINVDEQNEKLTSIDGALYTKDRKTLIKYPIGRDEKTVYLNDEIEVIEDFAMVFAQNTENVCLGDNVKSIGVCSLGDGVCYTKISHVYVPESVNEIGVSAFNCYDDYYSVVIGGKKGSYAEKFCLEREILFVEANKDNLDWFFSLSYDEHKKLMNEKIRESESVIDTSEFGFTTKYNKSTLYISGQGNDAKIEALCKNIPAIYRENTTKIVIGDGIKEIVSPAFLKFRNVESIEIGKDVSYIEAECFFYNSKLREIKVDKDNKYYTSVDNIIYSKDLKTLVKYPMDKNDAFFEIPSHVKKIGEYSFQCCQNLQAVMVGSSVTTLEQEAFAGCHSLRHIYVSSSVTEIESIDLFTAYGEAQTYFCNSGLVIGGKKDSAIDKAFRTTEVVFCHIEDDEIEDFLSCPITWEIYPFKGIEKQDPYIKRSAYVIEGDTLIRYKGYEDKIVTPAVVKYIADNAFKNSSYAKELVVSEGIMSAGEKAFSCMSNIKRVTLPSTIESLGDNAFEFCYGLKEINIPKSLTKIGKNAFSQSTQVRFTVDESNPNYMEKDGHLCTKDGKIISHLKTEYDDLPF